MKKVFSLLIAFVFPLFVYCCDCPALPALSAKVVDQYHLVFTGVVDSLTMSKDRAIAWFTVKELYKGSTTKVTPVYFDAITSCQMHIEKGDEWLIYAVYERFGKPQVNFCSRSRKYSTDEANDYYVVNNGMSYTNELAFLKTNFGTRSFLKEIAGDDKQMQRELIHPDQKQMLWLLLVSVLGFLIIYFLFKKYVK